MNYLSRWRHFLDRPASAAVVDIADLFAWAWTLMRLRVFGNGAIGGKQEQLSVPLSVFIEGFDVSTPGFMLAVVDLAQIQHLARHHFAAGTALVLDNIPVAVLFAVSEASVESQEHANQFSQTKSMKRYLVYTTADSRTRPFDPTRLFAAAAPQNRRFGAQVEKVGLGYG
jgi:hypothetical protein